LEPSAGAFSRIRHNCFIRSQSAGVV
jgi:hypothetical protein